MSKMTFVVEFPDGQEPTISAATDILGGKLLSFAFKDTSEDYSWRSAAEVLPPEGVYVLTHNGDSATVGRHVAAEWRSAGGGRDADLVVMVNRQTPSDDLVVHFF